MSSTVDWRVGFKKAATWNTAVPLGANDGVKILSESMPEGIPEPILDENVGDVMTSGQMQGNINAEGGFVEAVRYLGLERRLALFMGADVVTLVAGETVIHQHEMIFQPSNTGKFGTLAIDKGLGSLGSAPWEYPSVKFTGLELSHEGGKLQAGWNSLSNKCERDTAVIVNKASEFGALTNPTDGLLAIFNQMTLLIKEVTGAEGNLAGGDEIRCTNLKISPKRNLSGDHESGTGAGTIGEPETEKLSDGQLMFTVANYNATVDAIIKASQIRQPCSNPKRYKATVEWLGCDIPGAAAASKYRLSFDLPSLALATGPVNAGGPGQRTPVDLTFNISTPVAAGHGSAWAWVVIGRTPVRARLINTNSVSAA